MLDVTPLQTAVDALADRLRSLPQSRLHQGAATEGLALARQLATRAQLIERPGSPAELPDAGVFAAGDQLAVAGHDLVERCAPRRCGRRRSGDSDAKRAPADELAEAVRCVRAAAERC
ncbi:hypothetical protein O1L68_25270 [Streptomyces lydicus]|nr:hypothetical protein [Streptomyces lydicus]